MAALGEVEFVVTWLRPDGSTLDLPATVCFSAQETDGMEEWEIRAMAVGVAVEMTQADAPDELPEGSVPTRWTVMDGFRPEK